MTQPKPIIRRTAISLGTAAILAATFIAGAAFAADPKLDQAADSVTRAIDLLKAAEGNGKRPFGGHRTEAIKELERALKQIAKAKTYDDAHPAPSAAPAP